MKEYILAFDQGTTSSRAILFDKDGSIVSSAQKEIHQIYPNLGEVEHNPQEIWATQLEVAKMAIANSKVPVVEISAIGIGNQRETTIVWDTETGMPLYNAIVWQCRRTASVCSKLLKEGWEEVIEEKTGLVVDPYFSGTKIQWILDHVKDARAKAEAGEALFGNVDSWLIWNLTGGKIHITDYTNASRTMLFNIHKLDWDEDLLELLNIPRNMLPEVRYSSEIYGETKQDLFDTRIPIAGDMGDQQAALFGQTCFSPGMAKNTYGTGSFLLMNTGRKPVHSKAGLLTTIAAGIDGNVDYALEGSIFITGAAVQWLRDGLKLIDDSADSDYFARKVEDSGGIYFVPAFVGLGAPHWDSKARGLIIGITRGTTKNHLIRATLESIAFQVRDVLDCMKTDSKTELPEIRVDGGAAANNFLMQFQADIMGIPVVRPSIKETTALGVAYLAGLATDLYSNRDEIAKRWKIDRRFEPNMSQLERKRLVSGWKRAVKRSLKWES